MQFGVEIPGYIKWSLAQYVYKQWAGLYENLGRYVYVNRGFGFHAYPGRVGIMPEITVIQLIKGEKLVVKIDVDKNQELADALRIKGLPTLMIYKEGLMVWRQSGELDANTIIGIVQEQI
uniref:Thioredoxin domain-containing protein n=1 Tax=Hucho hucho TaxID=62062 RepID=A0A4W5LJK3_9TELE